MADALSRKSYCNNLMVMESQPPLHEEFQKLNLQLVPDGYLANLIATPTLEDKIRTAQRRDNGVLNIKANMGKESTRASLWMTRAHYSLKGALLFPILKA